MITSPVTKIKVQLHPEHIKAPHAVILSGA